MLNATLLGDAHDVLLNTSRPPTITHSPQSSVAHPTVANAQALQPAFQPPPPGELLVAQATLTRGGYRRSLPVLFYTSTVGNAKYVYPFSRTLIGTVWHTSEQLNACEFHYCNEPDSIRFCARRADLPAEMVQRLLVALEQNGGGAHLDLSKLQAWQADVRHPESRFAAPIPCTICGVINDVRLNDVTHLTGISNGLACHHLGRQCVHEEGDRGHTESTSIQMGPLPLTRNPSVINISPPLPVFPTSSLPAQAPMQPIVSSPYPNNHANPPGLTTAYPPSTNFGQRNDMYNPTVPTPSVWRQLDAYDMNPSMPPSFTAPQNYAPQQYNPQSVQPQNVMPIHQPHNAHSEWRHPRHNVNTSGQPTNHFRPRRNPCDNPESIPQNFPSANDWQAHTNYNTQCTPYPFDDNTKRETTSSLLCDEVIHPGEELHGDTDVMMHNSRHAYSDATHMPHPSMLVRGRALKSFTTLPPTFTERHELRLMKQDNRLERLNTTLSKKLADRTIPSFKGDSDNVQTYSQWEAALLKHFYSANIVNPAVRAWLAQNTFSDAANVWWVSHQSRRPTLTLSWPQLRELIQTELVPSVETGSANAAWADLTFDGNTESFFTRVRAMSLYHPLSPKELQVMASRPFGSLFVERVKGSSAQNGVRGLSVPQWEAMVRAYVKEQEAHPNFQAWGRGGLEPIHRAPNKLRAVCVSPDPEPQMLDDVPVGMDEEEWIARVAHLYSTSTPNPQGGRPLKIGKGPRPCFVCGSDAHSWIRCERKRRGKCGVCGGDNHYTRFCVQRFYPDPKLAATSPIKTSNPTSRCVLTYEHEDHHDVHDTTTLMTDSHLVEDKVEIECDAPSTLPVESTVLPVTNEQTPPWPSIRQVNIEQADDLALPSWLKTRLTSNGSRTRIGKAIIPIDNPSVTGQLHFSTTVEGVQAKMLYDPGASHCFIDWDWAHRNGIRIRLRPVSLLNMFQGTALGAIK